MLLIALMSPMKVARTAGDVMQAHRKHTVRRATQALWRVMAGDKVRKKRPEERSAESVARAREQAIEAWGQVATALAGSADAGDREVALDVVRYVDKHFGDGRVLDRLRPRGDRGAGIERE
jgi:hypothetical protein